MSILKEVSLYRKIKKNFQQDRISSTDCFSSRKISTKSDYFPKLFPSYKKTIVFYKTIPNK